MPTKVYLPPNRTVVGIDAFDELRTQAHLHLFVLLSALRDKPVQFVRQ